MYYTPAGRDPSAVPDSYKSLVAIGQPPPPLSRPPRWYIISVSDEDMCVYAVDRSKVSREGCLKNLHRLLC